MHIPDSVLPLSVALATDALAFSAVAVALAKMDYERVPRVGVLSSAFFIVSLMRLPIGPTSAHPALIGLMGLLLGWAAFPAVGCALFLQFVLYGHGGLVSLGANTLNMALPAVLCGFLFSGAIVRASSERTVFALGFGAGAAGLVLAAAMTGLTLLAAGREFLKPVQIILAAHLPVAIIEGFLTGSAVVFLRKVRPQYLDAPISSVALDLPEDLSEAEGEAL